MTLCWHACARTSSAGVRRHVPDPVLVARARGARRGLEEGLRRRPGQVVRDQPPVDKPRRVRGPADLAAVVVEARQARSEDRRRRQGDREQGGAHAERLVRDDQQDLAAGGRHVRPVAGRVRAGRLVGDAHPVLRGLGDRDAEQPQQRRGRVHDRGEVLGGHPDRGHRVPVDRNRDPSHRRPAAARARGGGHLRHRIGRGAGALVGGGPGEVRRSSARRRLVGAAARADRRPRQDLGEEQVLGGRSGRAEGRLRVPCEGDRRLRVQVSHRRREVSGSPHLRTEDDAAPARPVRGVHQEPNAALRPSVRRRGEDRKDRGVALHRGLVGDHPAAPGKGGRGRQAVPEGGDARHRRERRQARDRLLGAGLGEGQRERAVPARRREGELALAEGHKPEEHHAEEEHEEEGRQEGEAAAVARRPHQPADPTPRCARSAERCHSRAARPHGCSSPPHAPRRCAHAGQRPGASRALRRVPRSVLVCGGPSLVE